MGHPYVELRVPKRDGVFVVQLHCATRTQAEALVGFVNADAANNALSVENAVFSHAKTKDSALAEIMKQGSIHAVNGGVEIHGSKSVGGASHPEIPTFTADFITFAGGEEPSDSPRAEDWTALRTAIADRSQAGASPKRVFWLVCQQLRRPFPRLHLHSGHAVFEESIQDLAFRAVSFLGSDQEPIDAGVHLMTLLAAGAAQCNGSDVSKLLSQLSILVGTKIAAGRKGSPADYASGLRLLASTCDRDMWHLWDGVAAALPEIDAGTP